jgi:hypothetical protein
MTNEKLTWTNKDKYKLQRQILMLERINKEAEEKFSKLHIEHKNVLREHRDAEHEIKTLERGKIIIFKVLQMWKEIKHQELHLKMKSKYLKHRMQ